LAAFWKLFSFARTNLVSMNYSSFRTMVVQSLLAVLVAGAVSSVRAFTYSDGDVLLVFRKDGFKDVEFNIGSVNNFLGRADGTRITVSNWDLNLVNTTFNNNLNGVKFVLAAVTDSTNVQRRVWLTSANLNPATPVTDLANSKLGQLRAKISTIGTEATNATAGSPGLSFVIPSDVDSSYSIIVGEHLDIPTMGGTAPFPVETDIPGTLLFYELKISNINPKPAALRVGSFCLEAGGVLTFTAGSLLPLPQPAISILSSGGTNTISFLTTNCGNYRLRYTSDVGSTPWAVGASVTGNGAVRTLTDLPSGRYRFYVVEAFR
jgi:hypothetical protein